jgi:hypothetical protein
MGQKPAGSALARAAGGRARFRPPPGAKAEGRGAPRNAGACEAPWDGRRSRPGTLARRAASRCDSGRAPLGAPPRRSANAFAFASASGRACVSRQTFGLLGRQRAPRTGAVVPPGRFPKPPGSMLVRHTRRGRPHPMFKTPHENAPRWMECGDYRLILGLCQ